VPGWQLEPGAGRGEVGAAHVHLHPLQRTLGPGQHPASQQRQGEGRAPIARAAAGSHPSRATQQQASAGRGPRAANSVTLACAFLAPFCSGSQQQQLALTANTLRAGRQARLSPDVDLQELSVSFTLL